MKASYNIREVSKNIANSNILFSKEKIRKMEIFAKKKTLRRQATSVLHNIEQTKFLTKVPTCMHMLHS